MIDIETQEKLFKEAKKAGDEAGFEIACASITDGYVKYRYKHPAISAEYSIMVSIEHIRFAKTWSVNIQQFFEDQAERMSMEVERLTKDGRHP